jgi:hypothetical protein
MFDLSEVKAKALPRLSFSDVFIEKDGGLEESERAEIDRYLAQFTKAEGGKCPGCGAKLTGNEIEGLLGIATFTWGIAHGEGYCRQCSYPARAFHRNVGPIEFFNAVLPVHPDEIMEPSSAQDKDDE